MTSLPEPPPRLRPATPSDAAGIADLVHRAYAPWVEVIGRQPLPMSVDYREALGRNRFDLLFEDERLVGALETQRLQHEVLIVNVAVDPVLHGRGLGRRLLGHAEGLAVSAGLERVRLYTNARFERNLSLYGRLGYAEERREPFGDATVVHMVKQVSPPPQGTDLRVCVFGDSFTLGAGDDEALGWPGRVAAAARGRGSDLTLYNLGVRRETSQDIRLRWRAEATPRLPEGCDGRLLFAFGINDAWAGPDGVPRLEPAASLENARQILEEALALAPILVIGPLALASDAAIDARVEALSKGLGGLCAERGAPFLDLAPAARALGALWRSEAKAGDGVHPNALSYAVLAEWIDAWPAWRTWT